MRPLRSSHDVIVVGGGSAGSVVAGRLAAAGLDVLLVEAGGRDTNPAIHDPTRLFELWDGAEDWGYRTVPQAGCDNRRLHWPRGKVLGGSSSLNGMIYVRGHRSDYDAWAEAGCSGWGYHNVLPLFKRSEDFDRGASEYHGAGGPLRVLSRFEPHPVHAAVVEAAQQAGLPFNDDHNGPESDGVGYCHLTIAAGRRHSAASAFLTSVADAPNLTIATSARATRLVFEGHRCVGVELVRDGRLETVRAAHEVVACAGTIESPKLLMLSGLGPADELAAHGLDALVDLPGVGENLHDHVLCPVIHAARRPFPPALSGLQQFHSQLFWRSRPSLPAPDVQPLFFHLPLYPDDVEGPDEGMTLMAGLIRPESRGSLRLRSNDPNDEPALDPAYLSTDSDLDTLVAGLELCREIAARRALGDWLADEICPGPAVRSARELRDYARRAAITYHHQAGTCRMGVDDRAVVDPELRVRGVEGLRVADASVMPTVTAGNTHAPTVMIGERAAELVLAGLGRSSR